MSAPDRDARIVELARRLGAGDAQRPVETIVEACRRRVQGWMHETRDVRSIQELERLVCSRLGLEFEEFRHEGELDAIVRRHVEAGDVVFASLPTLFDDETFATLIRCRPRPADPAPRFVAVIDARGRKASRRWFSRWHEMAHLLASEAPTELQPVHRATSGHSAIERLMDRIAAELGFLEPLFAPVFAAEVLAGGRLDFAAVERARQRHAPEASFQATAIACLERWPTPAVQLEAGLTLTAAEARQFDQEPIPARRPTPKLRVLKVTANDAAREAGWGLVRHLPVPETSLLHRLFFAREPIGPGTVLSGVEDLEEWRRSNSRPLPSCRVALEARPGRRQIEAFVRAV